MSHTWEACIHCKLKQELVVLSKTCSVCTKLLLHCPHVILLERLKELILLKSKSSLNTNYCTCVSASGFDIKNLVGKWLFQHRNVNSSSGFWSYLLHVTAKRTIIAAIEFKIRSSNAQVPLLSGKRLLDYRNMEFHVLPWVYLKILGSCVERLQLSFVFAGLLWIYTLMCL